MVGLPIIGAGVVVERLARDDAAALSASHSDVENARFQGWASPLSVAEALAFIEANEAVPAFAPGTGVQLAIRRELGGPMVGDLYVHRASDTPDTIEVGITVCPDEHGRGLATAAIGAVADAVADAPECGIARIVAIVDVDNHPSRRLFARAGFTQVERRRGTSARRDGSTADEVAFAFDLPNSGWAADAPRA